MHSQPYLTMSSDTTLFSVSDRINRSIYRSNSRQIPQSETSITFEESLLSELLCGQRQRCVPKVSLLRGLQIVESQVFGCFSSDRKGKSWGKQILCSCCPTGSIAVPKESRGTCRWCVSRTSRGWSSFATKENDIRSYEICLRRSSIWRKQIHRRPTTLIQIYERNSEQSNYLFRLFENWWQSCTCTLNVNNPEIGHFSKLRTSSSILKKQTIISHEYWVSEKPPNRFDPPHCRPGAQSSRSLRLSGRTLSRNHHSTLPHHYAYRKASFVRGIRHRTFLPHRPRYELNSYVYLQNSTWKVAALFFPAFKQDAAETSLNNFLNRFFLEPFSWTLLLTPDFCLLYSQP